MKTLTLIVLGMIALMLSLGVTMTASRISMNELSVNGFYKTGSNTLENCITQIGLMGIPADNQCLCLNAAEIYGDWSCNGAPQL